MSKLNQKDFELFLHKKQSQWKVYASCSKSNLKLLYRLSGEYKVNKDGEDIYHTNFPLNAVTIYNSYVT